MDSINLPIMVQIIYKDHPIYQETILLEKDLPEKMESLRKEWRMNSMLKSKWIRVIPL